MIVAVASSFFAGGDWTHDYRTYLYLLGLIAALMLLVASRRRPGGPRED